MCKPRYQRNLRSLKLLCLLSLLFDPEDGVPKFLRNIDINIYQTMPYLLFALNLCSSLKLSDNPWFRTCRRIFPNQRPLVTFRNMLVFCCNGYLVPTQIPSWSIIHYRLSVTGYSMHWKLQFTSEGCIFPLKTPYTITGGKNQHRT